MNAINVYLTFFLVFLGLSTYSQHAMYVHGKGYNGYIFDSIHLLLKSVKNEQSRFTPSLQDIAEAEEILKQHIAVTNVSKPNQAYPCPVISKKLKKYTRQYFGFVDKQGNKIIWINLFWNKELKDRAKTDVIAVNDGCSYYWNIEVNITNKSLTNLTVNGSG